MSSSDFNSFQFFLLLSYFVIPLIRSLCFLLMLCIINLIILNSKLIAASLRLSFSLIPLITSLFQYLSYGYHHHDVFFFVCFYFFYFILFFLSALIKTKSFF
jgi:hypothetical protein